MATSEAIEKHTVPAGVEKIRLSDYLVGIFSSLPSRKSVKKAIDKKRVTVNHKVASTGLWVQSGMQIEVLPKAEKPVYKLDIPVVYEDEQLAIVNKPAGIATSGNTFKTLENTLPHNLTVENNFNPLPIHRLDRATSGLVIIAKTVKSRIKLGEMIANGQIMKVYHAIVKGLAHAPQQIESPIDGKQAVTEIMDVRPVIRHDLKLVKLKPKTGRTHQLRIHCAQQGFPIVGDQLYGDYSIGKGLFLCATSLHFSHPYTQLPLDISIDLPGKFQKLMP